MPERQRGRAEKEAGRVPRLLVFAFIGVGVAAASVSLVSLLDIRSQIDSIAGSHGRALRAFQTAESRAVDAIQEAYAYLLSGDPIDKAEFRTWARTLPAQAKELREALPRGTLEEHPEAQRVQRILRLQQGLVESTEASFARRDREGGVSPETLARHEGLVEALTGELRHAVDHEAAVVGLERDSWEHLLERAELLFALAAVLSLAVSLLVAIAVRRMHARWMGERERLIGRASETQRLESLGLLAGGVAHDFNNLLTAMIGNAELARMQATPGSHLEKSLEEIERAGMRGHELVRQIQSFAGRSKADLEQVSLRALVDDVLTLLEVGLPRGVEILRQHEGAEPFVACDPTQIRQVVMNLVTNAAEALGGEPGRVSVTSGTTFVNAAELAGCRVGSEQTPGEYAYVEVEDEGSGIAPEAQEKMFAPFFSTKSGARGLGLAAVYGILTSHRGALSLVSGPGEGACFRLLLPLASRPTRMPRVRPTAPCRGAGTILVIDDEEPVLSVSAGLLESLGFDTETALGGRRGIEALRRQPERIRAVLLDLSMPEMDGAATVRELRALCPQLPVVFTSGHGSAEADQLRVLYPGTRFLAKPFTQASLGRCLDRLFEAAPA